MPPLPGDFPSRHRESYLQAGELEPGSVYLCYARGARVAVFGGTGFYVPRERLGLCVMQRQRHWDDASPRGLPGTVKTFEKIELEQPSELGISFVQRNEIEPYLYEIFTMDEQDRDFVSRGLYCLLMTYQNCIMKRWR
jgi:hypothetical protein